MFCTNCGGAFPDDAPFCLNCGAQRPAAPPEVDRKALASLVLGIVGLFLSIFAAIPAVVVGHKSYSQIRKSAGKLSGEGIALAGLILGYIGIALFPIILIVAIPNLIQSRVAVEPDAAVTVRTLIMSEETYSTTYRTEGAGYAPDLATLGPGTGDCRPNGPSDKNACLIDKELGCAAGTSGQWCSKDQYRYSITGMKTGGSTILNDYVITATPVGSSPAKTYCATGDAVVRSHEGPPLKKPITSVEECEKWEAL